MSLYSGIAFSGQAKPPTADDSASPSGSSSTPAKSTTPTDSAEPNKAKGPTSGSNGGWSAALRFAPTQRPRKKPTAPTAASINALRSAMGSHEEAAPTGGPRIVGPAKASAFSAAPTILAPPTALPTPSASAAAPSASTSTAPAAPVTSGFKPVGRTIVPPSMTLDEGDVNGFRGTAAGKKAIRNNKKRGNNKSSNKREDPSLSFHPSVVYEVGKPCDYALYKAYVNQQRIQRRMELEEERRRGRDSDRSSYYSEDDEHSDHDNQIANKKARLYAPPSSYDDPPTATSLGAAPSFTPATSTAPAAPAFTPATAAPNAAAAAREETGEEAYQRRLAMSRGAAAPVAPPAAPAQPAYPSFSPASTSASAYSAPSAPYGAEPSQPPLPPSTFRPPPGLGRPTSADFFGAGSPTPPPPPPGFNPPPGFRPVAESTPSAPPSAYGGGAGPSFVSSSSLAGAGPAPSSAVMDAAAKAREIAARLSKLSGMNMPPMPPMPDASTPPSTSGLGSTPLPPAQAELAEPDTRSFAERYMAKTGWTEGRGLGASESGIATALSVQKAQSGQPTKKELARHKAAGTAPPPPPTGLAGRATVIDASRAERERAQVEKHGEPSRVVLLTNMVGPGEVDDELGGEVAEEANRFGVVERCFVHVVPGERREDEAVRIFLVMSGLAGGYNAVKQFEGRFFGGRTVRARFYREDDLKRGIYTA